MLRLLLPPRGAASQPCGSSCRARERAGGRAPLLLADEPCAVLTRLRCSPGAAAAAGEDKRLAAPGAAAFAAWKVAAALLLPWGHLLLMQPEEGAACAGCLAAAAEVRPAAPCPEGPALCGGKSSPSSLSNAAAWIMLLACWPNWVLLLASWGETLGLRDLVALLLGDSLLSAPAAMEERM